LEKITFDEYLKNDPKSIYIFNQSNNFDPEE
jgi:hypothetical protein